jgi:hypothetical protein
MADREHPGEREQNPVIAALFHDHLVIAFGHAKSMHNSHQQLLDWLARVEGQSREQLCWAWAGDWISTGDPTTPVVERAHFRVGNPPVTDVRQLVLAQLRSLLADDANSGSPTAC